MTYGELLAYVGDGFMVCLRCYAQDMPEDKEQLSPVFEVSDCQLDDGKPNSCDDCLGYLIEQDDSYNVHPLARSISALTVQCGDSELTRVLSEARHIALEHETDTGALMLALQEWAGATTVAHDSYGDTVAEVLSLAQNWSDQWIGREIVKLHATAARRVFVDGEGEQYRHTDTFGYLDVLESDCDGCGRCVYDEGYFSDFDTRCPDCVEIVD